MLVTPGLAHAACAFAMGRRSPHCLCYPAPLSIVHLPRCVASRSPAAARLPLGHVAQAAPACLQCLGMPPQTVPWCWRAPRTQMAAVLHCRCCERAGSQVATCFVPSVLPCLNRGHCLTLPHQAQPALPVRPVVRTCRALALGSQDGQQSQGLAQTGPWRGLAWSGGSL
jgi:hypothetical protein